MANLEGKKFYGHSSMGVGKDREKGRERIKDGQKMSGCNERRLWIFLAWGIVLIVFGIVAGGIYFNLRALTSSEEYTEVIPTYVNFITVIISGILVVILFWKRNIILVFMCVFVNVGSAFINGIAAILSGTLIIPPINKLLHCTFLDNKRECHCLSPYSRSLLQLDYSIEAPVTLIFQKAASCYSIEVSLIQILYALCGICVVSSILCIVSAILSLLVMRMERRKQCGFRGDRYDEIFTISNSNTPDSSDSENEHSIHSNTLTRPMLPSYLDLEVTDADSSNSRLRSSLQRSQSMKQPRVDSNNLDIIDNVAKETVTKGKLKEHRRRDRRAVTLHNLDSNQLMLILSLQMRYLKENDNSKSQVELSAKKLDEQLHRSFTPQPYHSRSRSCESERDVRRVRSHTPQPYKTKQQQMYENLQKANLNDFYENNIPPWERKTSKSFKHNSKVPNEKRKSIPHYEEIDDVTSYFSGDEEERIYANHPEVKHLKKKKSRPKIPIDSEESELSDIPSQRLRRSHRKNTTTSNTFVNDGNLPNNIPVLQNAIPNSGGRPKSYINAIDNPDPEPEDLYSKVHKDNPIFQQTQSQPNHLNDPEYCNLPDHTPSHPSCLSREKIYAIPNKKTNQHPPSGFQRISDSSVSSPVLTHPNLYQAGADRRLSAFQVVHRSSEAGTGIVGYIDPSTNHDYPMYSAMGGKNVSDKPPPYSPPPCYSDCLTNSRDSSLQSSSSSHHSAPGTITSDLYGKVNRRKPKFVYAHDPNQPVQTFSHSSPEHQCFANYSESQFCVDREQMSERGITPILGPVPNRGHHREPFPERLPERGSVLERGPEQRGPRAPVSDGRAAIPERAPVSDGRALLSRTPLIDGRAVLDRSSLSQNIRSPVPSGQTITSRDVDNLRSQYSSSSPFRTNYVINFDQAQPQVVLQGDSSDSDEMETVI